MLALTRRSGQSSAVDAAACDPAELDAAERRLRIRLPHALRALYGNGDGRFDKDGQWWVVWPLNQLVSETETYWREDWMDRSLVAFGDDGTGDPFCMHHDGSSDAIARWSMIEREVFENYQSMTDFTIAWLTPS